MVHDLVFACIGKSSFDNKASTFQQSNLRLELKNDLGIAYFRKILNYVIITLSGAVSYL